MTKSAKKSKQSSPNSKPPQVVIKQVVPQTTKRLPRMKISNMKNPLFGSNNIISNVDHLPAAFNTFCGNSTFLREAGSVKHPMVGIEGIALVGCQPLTDVITTGANSNLFTNGTLASAGVNSIALSVDALNGPLAAQANLHTKYVIRDILFEFVSNVATSQAGSMALGVLVDGATASGPASFSEVRQLIPSCSFPFRTDKAYLHYHYDGLDLWFTELDTASNASSRQTIQATLFGYPSASSIGAVTQGYINVWYNIELYQPVNSQGFTVTVKSRAERDLLNSYLSALRAEEKKNQSQKSLALEPKPSVDYFRKI